MLCLLPKIKTNIKIMMLLPTIIFMCKSFDKNLDIGIIIWNKMA